VKPPNSLRGRGFGEDFKCYNSVGHTLSELDIANPSNSPAGSRLTKLTPMIPQLLTGAGLSVSMSRSIGGGGGLTNNSVFLWYNKEENRINKHMVVATVLILGKLLDRGVLHTIQILHRYLEKALK
jgi:hypothetical protein